MVNHNTKNELERLLNILNHDRDPESNDWELFIQDNESNDGSWNWMWNHATDLGATAILKSINVGYSAACNRLAKCGSGDIVGLLNSDVWMTTGQIRQIQQAFDEDPSIAILGPKQRDEQGKITHAGIFGTNTKPKHRGWHEPDLKDEKYRDVVDAVTVSGAAYFVRREVWEELGQDPEYVALAESLIEKFKLLEYNHDFIGAFLPTRHYYEETWCSYFARHKGYRVVYDGRISIGHSWHASHKRGSPQDQMFRQSKAIFQKACDYYGIPRD